MMGAVMRTSPLNKLHTRLGAQMEEVDGWMMPHSFSSLLEEHLTARSACAVFDISSVVKFRISGNGAQDWLESAMCAKVSDCRDGTALHALMLNEDGKILDRVALLRVSGGEFLLIGHPGMEEKDATWLERRKPHAALTLSDETDSWCAMTLMGPQCEQVLARVLRGVDLPGMGRFSQFFYQGRRLVLARIGLHEELEEERAYEFFCPAVSGISWFESFIGAGARPCGIATRECLRLERGCVSMGRDIPPERHTPGQAGMEHLRHTRKAQSAPDRVREKVARLRCENADKSLPTPGCSVRDVTGTTVGRVTSAAYSPAADGVVAMALVSAALVHPGVHLVIMVDGREVPAQIM